MFFDFEILQKIIKIARVTGKSEYEVRMLQEEAEALKDGLNAIERRMNDLQAEEKPDENRTVWGYWDKVAVSDEAWTSIRLRKMVTLNRERWTCECLGSFYRSAVGGCSYSLGKGGCTRPLSELKQAALSENSNW